MDEHDSLDGVALDHPDELITGMHHGPDAHPDPVAVPAGEASGPPELSERDLAVLAFERTWWRHAGAKEEAIRGSFSISPARYYQLVDSLIDRPEALRHDPMLIGRLQRLRESRVARRAARAELRRPSGR